MPTTNTKTFHKEKRRKKLGPNIQSTNLNQTNRILCDRDQRKYELHDFVAVQDAKDVKNSSILKKLENYEIFKENYNCNLEVVTLQEKIADLVNQRDDLIRYHRILTGFGKNNCLKNINPNSLESEIADLKYMVGTLQKGVNAILDEHSVIKSLVIDQIKDMDNLLKWNSNQGIPKNIYNCAENPEKYVSPRFKENSGFLLPKYMNSNQSLFDICETSSAFNQSNSHLFKTISKISAFGDSIKNDSMAKFRQLAELKIIIEILQKYSKIVIDEFRNLNSSVQVTDKTPLGFQFKTNSETDQQDHIVTFQLGTELPEPENNVKPLCHDHPECSSSKCESNNLKTRLELPQEDLNMNLTKYKTGTEVVTEDQLEMPSSVLKSNPSLDHIIKNVFLKYEESDRNIKNILFQDGVLSKQSVFEKETSLSMTNSKKIVSTFLDSFGQDTKKSKKRKVLFLSDGHGRYCSQLLQDELGPNFYVISVVKADALFKEIIEDFQHLADSFSRADYVIIFAGSNNLKCKDKTQSHVELELVLPILKHTNVIFPRIPLLFDHPRLNSQIRRVNSENSRKVFELARRNSNIILMPKFTFFSRDHPKQNFNKIGKKTLCKLLAKTIITDSFGKIQKPCVEPLCIKSSKPSATSNPQEVTSNQSLDCFNEIKTYTTVISDESTKNKNNRSKEDTFDNTHQINKCKLLESNQQFRKSTQTQTSEEGLNEFPCQITNEKYKLLIEDRTISRNCVETARLYTQSASIERQSDVDRKVENVCKDYNSEDHHQQQGFFAGIFMKNNHTNMTTMKELLGQGDIPKPRKNFIQENVKRLKELKLEKTNKLGSQRNKTLQPLTERRNAQTMVSSSRFSQRHSVSDRPPTQQSPSPPLRSRRTNKHVTLDTQLPILEVEESPKGYRSQGCQTLSSKQLEHLYDEGVIRYPSVRDMGSCAEGERRIVREMALQTEAPLEVLHPPAQSSYTALPPLDEGLHWDEEKKAGDKDFVKMNATVPDPRRHKTPDPFSTDPTRAPPTYQRGIVPKYLREHKKEMERDRINKAKEDECPEGHIQLPEDIKQKHLATLRQNYTELVSQLNQLPVSTDTLRTRTRKKQIETDLDRIEAAIALFSREKVFVKADS